jgi:hypothetical protein
MTCSRVFVAAQCGVLVSVLAACSGAGGTASGAVCPPDTTLTYDSFGQPFLETWCGKCHGMGGTQGPRIVTAADVKAHRTDIDRVAASGPASTNTEMPPSKSPSNDERKKLGEWLACGAK